MENEHTLNALLRKRAELAGQFEHHQAKARQFLIDLDNVDATIRLFDHDIDLAEMKLRASFLAHSATQGVRAPRRNSPCTSWLNAG